MILDLYESFHKQFNGDYMKTSKRLSSEMSETLDVQDTRHRFSVREVYPLNIRGNSKWMCYRRRLYTVEKLEAEDYDGFLLNRSEQRRAVGMISKVKQALFWIRRTNIRSKYWKHLAHLSVQTASIVIRIARIVNRFKTSKRRSLSSWQPQRYTSHVRTQLSISAYVSGSTSP